jgi:hypothetical protein
MQTALQRQTENEHYVPQFYLRKFAIPGRKTYDLFVYDRNNAVYEKAVKWCASQANFYENRNLPSNTVEKFLEKIESKVGNVFKSIADRKPLSSDERWVLSQFLSIQLTRVPDFFDLAKKMGQALIGKAPDDLVTLSFITDEMAKIFFKMNWACYEVPTSLAYVTSDNPVSFDRTLGLLHRKTVVGFPVSPKWFLVMSCGISLEAYLPGTPEFVERCNRSSIGSAGQFVFASEHSDLIKAQVNEWLNFYKLITP